MPVLTVNADTVTQRQAPKGVPRHVAIIMDGNRRWAMKQGLKIFSGHKAGVEALHNVVLAADAAGIEALTVYAFSTENWNRSPEEVEGIMALFISTIEAELPMLIERNASLKFIGDIAAVTPKLQERVALAESKTAAMTGLRFQVALNYGGQAELVKACQTLAQQVQAGELSPESITAEHLESQLYTRGLPPVDFVIRTGGDYRLSNFLLWQCAYAEWLVLDTLWPEFTPTIFADALAQFKQRARRFGQ